MADDALSPPSCKRARLHTFAPPLLLFAHGAGAPSSSAWMLRWKELLSSCAADTRVVTFDYPYCAGGKRGAPPKAEKLVNPHLEEIKRAQSTYPGRPLVLVGKSMGSRVSCMVAAVTELKVSAIVCLGYPLKGTNGAIRDETLLGLGVPVMFVQGSKDPLCPLNKLEEVRKKMTCFTALHVIQGGDHSFKVSKQVIKNSGVTQDQIEQDAVADIKKFLEEVLLTPTTIHNDQ